MSSIYIRNTYGIKNPKIGLLNIGTEETKGNELTKESYKLLKEKSEELNLNFVRKCRRERRILRRNRHTSNRRLHRKRIPQSSRRTWQIRKKNTNRKPKKEHTINTRISTLSASNKKICKNSRLQRIRRSTIPRRKKTSSKSTREQ